MPSFLRPAAAAACLCASLALQAFPVSDYHAAPDDTIEFAISGSSAQDNTLERLLRSTCLDGSLDIYRAGGNQRAMLCRLPAKAGGIANIREGQKIAILKSSVGGSGYGVGPLITRRPLEFINLEDLKANLAQRCPAARTKAQPGDEAVQGYTEHQCSNPKPAFKVPDIGISDTEPQVFASDFGLGPEQFAKLVVRNANAFVFGVPVSLGLRDALQAAQFPADNPCHPSHPGHAGKIVNDAGDSVPVGESEACMPSLNRAQIAGIYAGTLTDWSSIVNAQGYPLASVAADSGSIVSPPGVEPPADSRIFLCRRVDTSGTHAAYEMFFLNARCTPGVSGFAKSSPTVQLGSGTSDVKFCLKDRDRRKLWAVGLFSTENVAKPDDAYRFIKVGNVAPTLLNATSGRWDFFVEQTFLWRGDRSEEPLTGTKLLLVEYFATEAGTPEIIRDLNRSFRHPWGDGGVLALNTNGFRPPFPSPGKPLDAAMVRENPVVALTRAAQGSSNSCAPPLANFPTVAP